MRLRSLALALAAFTLSLALAAASRAAAMTFEAVTSPADCAVRACVLATGVIDKDTGRDFGRFLRDHKIAPRAVVILDSEGGNVMQSLELGERIRDAGLATTVRAYDRATGQFRKGGDCASACVYAFLGGVDRSLGEGARIGVHQIYTMGQDWMMSAQDGMEIMSIVALHVRHMCGTLDLLIPALKTHPNDMHWLSKTELSRYAVITSGAPAA